MKRLLLVTSLSIASLSAPAYADRAFDRLVPTNLRVVIVRNSPRESPEFARGRGELNYDGPVGSIVVGTSSDGKSALGCAKYPFLSGCDPKLFTPKKQEVLRVLPSGDLEIYHP